METRKSRKWGGGADGILSDFIVGIPGRAGEWILSSLKLSREMTHCAVFSQDFRKKRTRAGSLTRFLWEMLCMKSVKTYLLNFVWIPQSDLMRCISSDSSHRLFTPSPRGYAWKLLATAPSCSTARLRARQGPSISNWSRAICWNEFHRSHYHY